MSLKISTASLSILQKLQLAGFEAYIVGGAIRDLLLARSGEARQVVDYDFTTNALPEQIQALFPDSFYENTFGTVSIPHEQIAPSDQRQPLKQRVIDLTNASKIHQSFVLRAAQAETRARPENLPHYQVTTFRSDELYDDFRRPSSMTWGESLLEDLDRRDFTINAMALQFSPDTLARLLADSSDAVLDLNPDDYLLIDPHQGQQDLEKQLIRTVGDPGVRFQEDALRMLRAIRFSVQLNLSIEDATLGGIQQHSQLISNISGERIRDEVLKMLKTEYPAEAIELLDTTHLLQHIIPELDATKGVIQGGHHTTDVWTHSLDSLRTTPATDPIVRLATLLHDIAKPQTQVLTPDNVTFYNHEVIGARIAKAITNRLRLSNMDSNRVFTLVRHHMFYYQPHNTDAAIRRFMRKVGLENIDDILDLREGDRLGSGAAKTSWRLEEMKQRMIEQLHQPMDVTDLAINGHDLITELSLVPGPLIGNILASLFEQVLDKPELNTREYLLTTAKQLVSSPTQSGA